MNLFVANRGGLFIVLILIQVLIFSHINFLGFVNPMVYLLFIIKAPISQKKIPLLFSSFLLGLVIDIMLDTGGLHAASSVFVAYLRPKILNISFGKKNENQYFNLLEYPTSKVLSYVSILVVLHHSLFYFLEIFNFNHILATFAKIIVASFFTILICMVAVYTFSSKKA